MITVIAVVAAAGLLWLCIKASAEGMRPLYVTEHYQPIPSADIARAYRQRRDPSPVPNPMSCTPRSHTPERVTFSGVYGRRPSTNWTVRVEERNGAWFVEWESDLLMASEMYADEATARSRAGELI